MKRMTKMVVELIDQCAYCTHKRFKTIEGRWCYLSSRPIPDGPDIPEWCLLPNAEEMNDGTSPKN